MEDAYQLCDRVLLLDKGKVICVGKPDDLIKEYVGNEIVEFKVKVGDINYYIKKVESEYDYQVLNDRIRLFIKSGQDGKSALNLFASDDIVVRKANLEDVFLKLTGHSLQA